jgi:hypothetical protein
MFDGGEFLGAAVLGAASLPPLQPINAQVSPVKDVCEIGRCVSGEARGPKANGRRQVQIIETRCIGICPKKAVTALNASSPGRILTVPKGTHPKDALTLLIPDSAEAAVAL